MKKIIEVLKKYKIYIICFSLILLSIISIIVQNIDRKNTIKVNGVNIQQSPDKIGVYVTGEVKNSGVYYVSPNSRVSDAIDIAGGITEKADINNLNLSKKLVDSDKIVVPVKQEKYELETQEQTQNTSDLVNINDANEEELMTLKGIGQATAKKIIEYRKNNTFEKIEDIMNVSGIGESKFNAIKDYICVK